MTLPTAARNSRIKIKVLEDDVSLEQPAQAKPAVARSKLFGPNMPVDAFVHIVRFLPEGASRNAVSHVCQGLPQRAVTLARIRDSRHNQLPTLFDFDAEGDGSRICAQLAQFYVRSRQQAGACDGPIPVLMSLYITLGALEPRLRSVTLPPMAITRQVQWIERDTEGVACRRQAALQGLFVGQPIGDQGHQVGIMQLAGERGFRHCGVFDSELRPQGWGARFNATGVREGTWRDGQLEGVGLTRIKGCEYIGDHLNNQKHGFGRAVFPDGSTYDGAWQADRYYGEGQHITRDGNVRAGRWQNSQLMAGTLTYGPQHAWRGYQFVGEFENNEPEMARGFVRHMATGLIYADPPSDD
ncbi:hypothetical protein [Novosphingobium sp.]|uniref:hypothetical protein n=1 Tax=Novosphingobium sp. TaxID=1874826 RepID=UPI003D14FBC5